MSKTKKILIVDDERAIADSLAVILRQGGFEVHVAYSGGNAIQLAERIIPDLVLSDVMMPDKNGIQVATEVQEKVPGCKILLFSGSAAAADLLMKARRGGRQWEILAEPIYPRDLLVKLQNLAA